MYKTTNNSEFYLLLNKILSLKISDLCWLAGFIDGDGHIGCRIKPRADYKHGYQLLPYVSFTQKDKRGMYLFPHMKKLLFDIGSYRNKGDGVWVYELENKVHIKALLTALLPYIWLKRKQVKYLFDIINQYDAALRDPKLFLSLCYKADHIAMMNDRHQGRKHTGDSVAQHLKNKKLI